MTIIKNKRDKYREKVNLICVGGNTKWCMKQYGKFLKKLNI
jgi:hypothetical protein